MVRRRRLVRRRPGLRRRGRKFVRRNYARAKASGFGGRGVRTFTEMFSGGQWFANSTGAGALIRCRMDDLDEVNQQSALQTQYCIRKMQVIIVPSFTSYDRNIASDNGLGTNNVVNPGTPLPFYGTTRIITSIQDSGNAVAPTSQSEALDDNGCKIRMLGSRPLYLACRPKPALQQGSPGGGGTQFYQTNQRATQWIEFDHGGSSIQHGGISTWSTLNVGNQAGDLPVGDYQIKITFSVRDPR